MVLAQTPVIVDNGSLLIKAGFSGEEKPACVVSSLVGRPKPTHKSPEMLGAESKLLYLGREISSNNRCFLNVTPCIVDGYVQQWDDMESVWNNLFFNELRLNPIEHPMLMIEHDLNPISNAEKTMSIMFETFRIPKFYSKTSGSLILYSSGNYTGLSVDIGHNVTTLTPIYGGYTFYNAVKRVHLGGDDVTKQLKKLLMIEKGFYTESFGEHEAIRIMKENCCFVARNYDEVMNDLMAPRSTISVHDFSTSYTLPCGTSIELDAERFRAPEILYKPQLIGRECEGLPELICSSIMACDADTRPELFDNIIVSGGSSQFANFDERLTSDVASLTKRNVQIKSCDTENRCNSPFIGGSILTSLGSFDEMWITAEEFNESGSYALMRRRKDQYYY
ncbi:hypothetical protein C9374_014497 [Naegleria lovaniensis]|uniref:Actin n=1 Tax=Naegleria lovaniensis TaxID=51637 RepID=A0AA88KUA6_NAELO|nr:uncharacterized protein C9374_014497 [Naegleria lovaniensis]KAG2389097.1 hypothetical protein C9374_014497 [Naegleria lovaniensis]